MADLKAILERLRHWLGLPLHTLTGRQRTLRWWLDLFRHGVAELRQDRASQMAASLTYHTLLSLLPTVVLMLVVLHAFVSEADRVEFKRTLVNWALAPIQHAEPPVSPTRIDSLRAGSLGEDVREALEEGERRRLEFDRMRTSLAERIEGIIDGLEQVNFRSISIAGILLFIYAATGLLSTIEGSFNTVYGAAQGRSLFVRLPIYYTVITLAPIVILAGQVLRRSFMSSLQTGHWTNWLIGSLAVIAPLLSAWATLTLMYVLLPNTRVRIRIAAIGGFVSAVFWVVGNQLFSIYVQRAAVSTLYGALGLLPLFLLWVWLTWLIILFGLEVSYTLQAMMEGKFRHGFSRSRAQTVIDRALIVPVAARIAEGFRAGRLVTLADVSRAVGIPESAVDPLVDALRKAGLVHAVKDGRESGYSLAQPAEAITAADVLAAGESLLPSDTADTAARAWAYVETMGRRLEAEAGATTLAELARAES